jgi:hypothetical protein
MRTLRALKNGSAQFLEFGSPLYRFRLFGRAPLRRRRFSIDGDAPAAAGSPSRVSGESRPGQGLAWP